MYMCIQCTCHSSRRLIKSIKIESHFKRRYNAHNRNVQICQRNPQPHQVSVCEWAVGRGCCVLPATRTFKNTRNVINSQLEKVGQHCDQRLDWIFAARRVGHLGLLGPALSFFCREPVFECPRQTTKNEYQNNLMLCMSTTAIVVLNVQF